uniref:Guanine nucleotide-binding protein alpha subunit n=1 Tax=Oryza meridionalis TaxID=40149 RepID=A0A0E0DQ55_9ORYZ
MENLDRLAEADYVPTKEDVLYARVRTNGVVQIQFSPVGENKRALLEKTKEVDRYDQMLFEDETKNRMMEIKELFDWVLKQRCFEKTSFMLFLNKFDIFEKKIQKVPLSVCEWFKDYQPIAPRKQEVEHAYEFVKKKFEELYFQSSKLYFKIYRTTALDQKLVKKTFKSCLTTTTLMNYEVQYVVMIVSSMDMFTRSAIDNDLKLIVFTLWKFSGHQI